jgi:hypothetical protein
MNEEAKKPGRPASAPPRLLCKSAELHAAIRFSGITASTLIIGGPSATNHLESMEWTREGMFLIHTIEPKTKKVVTHAVHGAAVRDSVLADS